ncbi:hypothetical protein GGS23DRAFT_178577 [Durotheca rogersii]|uniref:uncharacterized protein n=1 Tax=Durotheca rogersii TaxID=419775 RepID=UPI00221F6400|nr:uncharacterized protein GGS23DRAFT_178577 [Durotheca rogersii]KAI5867453.1 hypothetical protein GGS23DRAFT_178577 [Durotheca rogersii]
MAYRSSRRDVDDDYEPYERRRSPPRRAGVTVREYEDIDVQPRDRDRADRTPAFLREDVRRTEAGALVLRQREVESVDRRRARSPSPVRYQRYVERGREREPSLPPMSRQRYVEHSPSPPPAAVRVESRTIERRRERSPTPDREHDYIRLRIEREKEQRAPSPSPSPPPPQPQVIRGPTIEREVITHYRDIDHGVERVKPPTPPPPPRTAPPRVKERDLDIDIDIRRNETDVDIRHRTRSRSRPRERPLPPRRQPTYYDEDDLVYEKDRDSLRVIETHRRAHSAAPRPDYTEEAEYITDKIDARGRMGEARNGVTRDWTIIDVPPGTERVQMDGVGGGAAEVTWQRYNGVRRSRFIPDREGTPLSAVSEPIRERDQSREQERLSVQIYDKRERSRDRDVDIEEITDRRITIRNDDRVPPRKRNDMWTEITKDLVVREAIEKLGYEYEETDWFFYVMQYLRYVSPSPLLPLILI